jgi:hypothetical protein
VALFESEEVDFGFINWCYHYYFAKIESIPKIRSANQLNPGAIITEQVESQQMRIIAIMDE